MSDIPVLELHDIQGDVLVGLQKDFELFVFFEIVAVSGFKQSLRSSLSLMVTSVLLAKTREMLCDARRAAGQGTRLALAGLNVGFTATGLEALLGTLPEGLDPSFVAGAAARARALGDPVDEQGVPSTWRMLEREPFPMMDVAGVADFPVAGVDGVLLMTGGDLSSVADLYQTVRKTLGDTVRVVYAEMAHVRLSAREQEHFGFRTGISQPGVLGLDHQGDADSPPGKGGSGQDLLRPGEFLLGHPRGHEREGATSAAVAPWMRNGSYMVFRRLRQYVPEFRDFVAATALALNTDDELVAARLMGRWRSGAPLALAPLQDDAVLGADPTRNNDFTFGADAGARRCPYAAHIRKTNPRDDLEAVGRAGLTGVQQHRVRRAGIAYGPDVTLAESRTSRDRGLMFVCYQSSIERQFEFIQREWANNAEFPPRDSDNPGARRCYPDGSLARPGEDPIIGRASAAGSVRHFEELAPNYPKGDERTVCPLPRDFVEVTAAGYFFMPALGALSGVLSD